MPETVRISSFFCLWTNKNHNILIVICHNLISFIDVASITFAAGSCHRHAVEIDNNLFLCGNTGVGKSFLSHCIMKEALDRSYSALYFTAGELFDLLADARFGRSQESLTRELPVYECDLLVIDDLGTELTNSFVAVQLFRLLNDRILRKRSTIISTNLTLNELSGIYTERVFSRITSHYTIIKLIGEDIRIQKKLKGGSV